MTYGVICYLYSHFGEANSILLYKKDGSPKQMDILNWFQDLSAEKDKKRVAVRS